MKSLLLIASLIALQAPADPSANIAYFAKTRELRSTAPDHQNYFVVGPQFGAHAKPGLADLRIYADGSQVPYVLITPSRQESDALHAVRILNLGQVNGAVEFDLDMHDTPEYNRVQLTLTAHDFVSTAEIEGCQQAPKGECTLLGTSTLYDFSREHLGSNSTLHFPASTFPFLHVKIATALLPQQVTEASAMRVEPAEQLWANAGKCADAVEEGRVTVVRCAFEPGMPVERVIFRIGAQPVNFYREVTVLDANNVAVGRSTISRVHLRRGTTEVAREDLVVSAHENGPHQVTLKIENGDDKPLQVLSAEPQALERRVYFEPSGRALFIVFYGDSQLGPPQYDYARFFHLDPSATIALLGPERDNPGFASRPDGRPWSERHKFVLWAALLAAVLLLAVVAIRSLREAGKPTSVS
jgi:hypothetical protein